MAFNQTETDKKLARMYADKRTCNGAEVAVAVDPEVVWHGMNFVAMYNKTLSEIKHK